MQTLQSITQVTGLSECSFTSPSQNIRFCQLQNKISTKQYLLLILKQNLTSSSF